MSNTRKFKTAPVGNVPTRTALAWKDGDVVRFASLWVREGRFEMALTRPRAKDEGFIVILEADADVRFSLADEDLRAAHGVRLCHDEHCVEVYGGSHPVTRVKPGRGAITCVARNTARTNRRKAKAANLREHGTSAPEVAAQVA